MSLAKVVPMPERTVAGNKTVVFPLFASPIEEEEVRAISSKLKSSLGDVDFDRMVRAIYAGLLEPEPWQYIVKFLARYMDVTSAIIVVRPSTSDDLGYLACYPPNPPVERIYQEELWRQDPFLELPVNKLLTIDEAVGAEEWLNSDFYQQIFGSYGTRYGLGVNLVSANGTICRIRLYRMHYEGAFTREDKARLALLDEHFHQALALANRLHVQATENELYEGALNRLHIGAVVLDENKEVLRANQVAKAILDENDGLHWSAKGICTHYRTERQIFRELLDCGSDTPQVMSVTRPSGRRKLGLVVRSIPVREGSEGKGRPAWICFICDPDVQTKAPREVMRQVFEFTPSEANLAMELANGLSLDEAAEALGIRRNTARTHLRAIFAKAGVSRQAELVRLVLNGIIGLSAPQE